MRNTLVYPIGSSSSCQHAAGMLENAGLHLTDHPTPDITHLLLDIPSFSPDGTLTDGADLQKILQMLPSDITIIGGNLDQDFISYYKKIDLLKDQNYLAMNASITAECAIRVASPYLKTTFKDSPALILGWGRIGKCLAELLSSMGCPVTVCARKESDRALLRALGFYTLAFDDIPKMLHRFKLLFNTVPEVPLQNDILEKWTTGVPIDLASHPGMQGRNVVTARGLPRKYAPESSGNLIAETIIPILKEETQ